MVLLILVFFYNARFLYASHERSVTHPEFLQYLLNGTRRNVVVITNSIEVSYWIPLYTKQRIYFKNFSVQPFGYREHTKKVVKNFVQLGLSKDEIISIFKDNATTSNWINNRKNLREEELTLRFNKFYNYSVAFNALYKNYNYQLLKDNMMSQDKNLNDNFYKLIEVIYDEIVYELSSDESEYEIIIDKNYPFNNIDTILKKYSYSEIKEFDQGDVKVIKNARLLTGED